LRQFSNKLQSIRYYLIKQKIFNIPVLVEVLRFGITGISNTVLCVGSLVVFVEIFNINYLISNNLATVITWIYAYSLNKSFVFRNRSRKHLELSAKFIILQLLLLGWTNLILYLLVGLCGINYLFVIIGNAVLMAILNFLCQKILIFQSNSSKK